MSKIAHLILAHNHPEQLTRLINRLTHSDAHIYIHLDGKANVEPFAELLKTPNVYLIQKRVKVYWGSYSIVQATINSFAQILATKNPYSHINLLSGNDYPIKNIQQIHEFLDQHSTSIFMEYVTTDSEWWTLIKTRLTRYHLTDFHFPGCYQAQLLLNKIMPERKLPKSLVFVGRSQWLTITCESAQYVIDYLKKNSKTRRFFRFSWGADEVMIQTIIYSSPFKDQIVNNNYRYIDWSEQNSSPKTLNMDDAEKIMQSPCLFARKFDMAKEPEILNYLDIALS